MRVYTIEKGGVREGVMVETTELPTGYRIPVLGIGEEGRGRLRVEIPVRLQADSWKKWDEEGQVWVTNLNITYTRLGDMRFEEFSTKELRDEYLVVFRGWIGFRGWNKLELASGQPIPQEMILGLGQIAQGEAGRMGAGNQWILRVHMGDILRYKVGGRLYGEPGEYVIPCGVNGPVLYPDNLYRLSIAYDER